MDMCVGVAQVLVWALGVPATVHGSMNEHWTTVLPYNHRALDAVALTRGFCA